MLETADDVRLLITQGDYAAALDALVPQLPGAPGSATQLNVLSGFRIYFTWITETGGTVLNAGEAQAQAYRSFLANQYAPATTKNRLTQVRTLYDLLQDLGLVTSNPYRAVQGVLNRPEEHRQAYTIDEIERLLQHANVEERALVLLGAHGGLTGPEVLNLKFEDLDLTRGQLLLTGRTVQASEDLLRALERWGHQRGHTALFSATGTVFEIERVFLLRKRLFLLCQKANVTYKAWQALRHAAGIRLLEQQQRLAPATRVTIRSQLGLASRESLRPLVKLSGKSRRRRLRREGQDPA